MRAWELDAEDFLRGGVGLMPLAVLGRPPIGQTRLQALPTQVERIHARALQEAPAEAGVLLTAAYILATMHVNVTIAKSIFTMVTAMRDLPGYQLILEEGAIEHQREFVLKLGRKKLGEPTDKQVNRLNAIEDIERLDRLVLKVTTAKSWDALLRVK